MLSHCPTHFLTLKEWVGFSFGQIFWWYLINRMLNLIGSLWLVCNTFSAYVKTILVVDVCVCNTFIIYVTILALGSQPKRGHGNVRAECVTWESHSYSCECERVRGNEPTHFQVESLWSPEFSKNNLKVQNSLAWKFPYTSEIFLRCRCLK